MAEWKDQAIQTFRGAPAYSVDQLPQALQRARNLNGKPDEPWTSIGYEWLESFRFDVPPHVRTAALQALLDAGLDPNGGGLTKWSQQTAAMMRGSGANRSKGAGLFRLGLPTGGSSHPDRFGMPWLGRLALHGHKRRVDNLPELMEMLLQAGASPTHQPMGNQEFEPDTGWIDEHSGDEFSSRVTAQTSKNVSSWLGVLATGRLDVVETVLKHSVSRPADWSVAVSAALQAGITQGNDEAVVKAVSRFAEQFPPTAVERAAVTLILGGRRTGGDWLPHPEALVAWLGMGVSGFSKNQAGIQVELNPWSLVVVGNQKNLSLAQRFVDVLVAHPTWGTPQRLQQACAMRGNLLRELFTSSSSPLDAWLVKTLEPQCQESGLGAFQRRLLGLASEWGIRPSSDFPAVVAQQGEEFTEAAVAWLKAHPTRWQDNLTPWHYAPQKLAVWPQLEAIGARSDAPDSNGVPGLLKAASMFLVQGKQRLFEEVLKRVDETRFPAEGVQVHGLDWAAWRWAGEGGQIRNRSLPPADGLGVGLFLGRASIVQQWLRANPRSGWETQTSPAALLSMWAGCHASKELTTFARTRQADGMVEALAALRQAWGTDLASAELKGWFTAVSVTAEKMHGPRLLLEAWEWVANKPLGELSASDRRSIASVWCQAVCNAFDGYWGGDALLWEGGWKQQPEEDASQNARRVLRSMLSPRRVGQCDMGQMQVGFQQFLAAQCADPERLMRGASAREHRLMAATIERRTENLFPPRIEGGTDADDPACLSLIGVS